MGSMNHCHGLLDTLDQEGSPYIRKYNYALAIFILTIYRSYVALAEVGMAIEMHR